MMPLLFRKADSRLYTSLSGSSHLLNFDCQSDKTKVDELLTIVFITYAITASFPRLYFRRCLQKRAWCLILMMIAAYTRADARFHDGGAALARACQRRTPPAASARWYAWAGWLFSTFSDDDFDATPLVKQAFSCQSICVLVAHRRRRLLLPDVATKMPAAEAAAVNT